MFLTIGSNTELVPGIFLDDVGNLFDELGIRVANSFIYDAEESVRWLGIGTLDLDISNFALGLFNMAQLLFVDSII